MVTGSERKGEAFVDILEAAMGHIAQVEEWLRVKLSMTYKGTSVEMQYEQAILHLREARDTLAIERKERRYEKAESA